jgi:chromodomain-helicase-DNA-binding protein 4
MRSVGESGSADTLFSQSTSASWDAPPCPDEAGYEAFRIAFERFIEARRLSIPRRDKAFYRAFDKRGKDAYRKSMLKNAADLDLGQSKALKLLPFQVRSGLLDLGNHA